MWPKESAGFPWESEENLEKKITGNDGKEKDHIIKMFIMKYFSIGISKKLMNCILYLWGRNNNS